jgi:hypothetical protein
MTCTHIVYTIKCRGRNVEFPTLVACNDSLIKWLDDILLFSKTSAVKELCILFVPPLTVLNAVCPHFTLISTFNFTNIKNCKPE